MTETQYRQIFETDGVVCVRGLLSSSVVEEMRAYLWEHLLERGGLSRTKPESWGPGGHLKLEELVGALRPGASVQPKLWEVGGAPIFQPLQGALSQAVKAVFGYAAWEPADECGGLPMPALPLPEASWNVPHAAWHADEPAFASENQPRGLLAFAFLDTVAHQGGGTMVLAGSHRRIMKLAEKHATPENEESCALTCDVSTVQLAKQEPWMAELLTEGGDATGRVQRFMTQGCVSDGVPMRVVECTGEPGDITLMDPRCLHTLSANIATRPRLVMRMLCMRGE